MTIPRIGERARSFRLPSAQGGEVGLDDFKNRSAVVVWFTKGMACPFCRQQMSQLARAYPQIKERGGEVLEVTSSTPARAQFYARRFTLPFPYLCDPDHRVRADWGLQKRAHGLGYYAKTLVNAMKMEPPAGPGPHALGPGPERRGPAGRGGARGRRGRGGRPACSPQKASPPPARGAPPPARALLEHTPRGRRPPRPPEVDCCGVHALAD